MRTRRLRFGCDQQGKREQRLKEDLSYTRSQYEKKTLAPARRKARAEMAVCTATVAVLVFCYLNARFFHLC
jgi:hypothetical protein